MVGNLLQDLADMDVVHRRYGISSLSSINLILISGFSKWSGRLSRFGTMYACSPECVWLGVVSSAS